MGVWDFLALFLRECWAICVGMRITISGGWEDFVRNPQNAAWVVRQPRLGRGEGAPHFSLFGWPKLTLHEKLAFRWERLPVNF